MNISQLQGMIEKLMLDKGHMKRIQPIEESAGRDQASYYMGALLSTEPAEYIDAVKKGLGLEAELEEVADVIIRAINIFVYHGVSAEDFIMNKMHKNFDRPPGYGHNEMK